MTLEFDEYGRTRLERLADGHGLSIAALVGHAAVYSLRSSDQRGASRRVPRLRTAIRGSGTLSLSLELRPDDWLALEAEAEHQGETMERLIEHAAVHMLADADAGRLELGGAGDRSGAALEQG
jgi:hypothetical protein